MSSNAHPVNPMDGKVFRSVDTVLRLDETEDRSVLSVNLPVDNVLLSLRKVNRLNRTIIGV